MTITPWHSQIDFDIAKKYNLDYEQIIDLNGRLLPIAEEFAGMKIKEARDKIVDKLKLKGLVTRIDENYTHNTKVCYKCNSVIEPQVNDQWFIQMKTLSQRAIEKINNDEIIFYPKNAKLNIVRWLENIIDWNISRQIVWGIQIPAQFCSLCNKGYIENNNDVGKCTCGGGLVQETNTFDTWFSSGQWSLLTTGYDSVHGSTSDFQTYFPTSVMETGYDILYFWVARMIMFSLYLTDKVPFKNVYLHGLVNDKHGKKMSKSKGNVINPIELVNKFGCDALRMGLVVGSPAGSDTNLSEDKINAYKKFCNKLWNIARYVATRPTSTSGSSTFVSERNKTHISAYNEYIYKLTEELENLRVDIASDRIYHFVWDYLATVFIEDNKKVVASGDKKEIEMSDFLLREIFLKTLISAHPVIPFITEEIWGSFVNVDSVSMLITESFPTKIIDK